MFRTLGAQEYTRQLKNRVVSKSIETSPQPAHRRYNYVPISVQGNRANQVVKLVSDPAKSCSGGWKDESGCCEGANGGYVIDFMGNAAPFCLCSPAGVEASCPSAGPVPPIPQPTLTLTVTFTNGSNYESISGIEFIRVDGYDFTGTTATVDGIPALVTLVVPPAELTLVGIPGPFTANSVIQLTFLTPIDYFDAFCAYSLI